MSFNPSPQQAAVFEFVSTGQGNAFVEAVAGAGKTTTLVEACALMSGTVAFAAFNKKIAVEIEQRVTAKGLGVDSGTFHSYGLKAWTAYVGKRVQVDQYKKWDRLLEQVPAEYHGFVKKAVSLAKQKALGVFGSIRDTSQWYAIVDHFNLTEELDEKSTVEEGIRLSIITLEASINMARSIIDFDDMIFMPVLTGAPIRQYAWVLVDEAQDTNAARRALARKMLKPGGRAIFVGDRHQAIYGFTGADNNAVDLIIEEFNCASLPLTVTYRCPKTVVSAAQRFVSHIQAHETAPEGIVEAIDGETFSKDRHGLLTASDAILCRNTAPLVKMAYRLIRKGIPCHVEGRDIGQGLLVLIDRWKLATVDAFLDKLDAWEEKQTERLRAKGQELGAQSLNDKAETLRVLCEGFERMSDVRARIKQMFQDTEGDKSNTLTLSTVHKAKGREWDHVYILDYARRMPSKMARMAWEQDQETNIIYVAFTRAKKTLTLID